MMNETQTIINSNTNSKSKIIDLDDETQTIV